MNFFRPAEIRAILFLSILVFIGSMLTLLKRQGKISNLDLATFLNDSRYNYSYNIEEITKGSKESAVKSISDDYGNTEVISPEIQIIDLNKAGYFDFQSLPGVGPVLAERIIAYRDSVGSFRSIDELLNVKGIGPKKYALIKERITVE